MPDHTKASSGPLARFDKKRLAITGGAIAGVAILIAVILVVTGGSPKKANAGGAGAKTPSTAPTLAGNLCPLTGAPAPGGAVPKRPALLVKIGNEPDGARPQSGLNEADIVFDTPAEGFIMRYMAVYQCNNASSIGPTRSVRWVDYHLARMFVHPILTFAGGINPNVDTVMADSWISPANLLAGAGAAGTRISSRVAPDNLYTSTSSLWALYPKSVTPPPPIFTYSSSVPSGATATSGVQINFSSGTDAIWKWNAAGNDWVHSYTTGADTDTLTGAPVSTTNVVMMIVTYHFGPYIESTGGSGDFESQTEGQGQGYVLRNGKRIAVTWHRKDLLSPLTFTDSSGQAVALAPGRTWVELVPDTVDRTKGNVTFSS